MAFIKKNKNKTKTHTQKQNFNETKNEVTPKYFNLIYKSRLWTLTKQLQNLHFSFETIRSGFKKTLFKNVF